MNQKFLTRLTPALLGAATLAAIANVNSANAAELAAGRINLNPIEGVEFLNNAIDFDPNNTNFAPGDISQGGPYGINFATGGFADEGFLNAPVQAVDLYTPSDLITSGPTPGSFANGINYDLVSIFAPTGQLVNVDGMEGLPLLYYDLDGPVNFSDGDDAIFYATGFTRSTTEEDDGSFDVSLNYQGFIATIDNDGSTFDKTIVDVTLFNGATSLDPETLPAINDPLLMPPSQLPNPDFTNLDGVQEVEGKTIPEASNIVAILSLGALALTMKLKKIKVA